MIVSPARTLPCLVQRLALDELRPSDDAVERAAQIVRNNAEIVIGKSVDLERRPLRSVFSAALVVRTVRVLLRPGIVLESVPFILTLPPSGHHPSTAEHLESA